MVGLYLANFGSLPILVNSFWKIARNSGNFPYRKNFYNKRLSLVTKDISFYCVFSKKYCLTDKFESNKHINSNLIITSKNFKIKEFCNYSYYDRNKYLDLEYSLNTTSPEINLQDKINLSYGFIDNFNLNYEFIDNLEISNNFYSSLLPQTQEILVDVKQILEKNEDKIEIL